MAGAGLILGGAMAAALRNPAARATVGSAVLRVAESVGKRLGTYAGPLRPLSAARELDQLLSRGVGSAARGTLAT